VSHLKEITLVVAGDVGWSCSTNAISRIFLRAFAFRRRPTPCNLRAGTREIVCPPEEKQQQLQKHHFIFKDKQAKQDESLIEAT
jgi:hypothetical protein